MARLRGEPSYRLWVLLMATMLVSALAIFVALTLLFPDVFGGLAPSTTPTLPLG